MFSIKDLILKKRNGLELSPDEINYFVSNLVSGQLEDYQVSAFLMAIYFQGLNRKETIGLTKEVINSGEIIDLSLIPGTVVDKHSTGGVGDKTSLALAPMVASAGVPVAKLSGRGMGHTGGTLDKISAFEGINLSLNKDQILENVQNIGIALSGQTNNLVPADKILYALRDVTCTIDNISLIACSIMSKKIASGSDAIVLDVKVGSGAFMTNYEEALKLAKLLVEIGNGMDRETIAYITHMDQPLGNAVGNILELEEAIQTLKGQGPKDFLELCLTLGSEMILLAGLTDHRSKAIKLLEEKISSGSALDKFRELIIAQGGDPKPIDKPDFFKEAKHFAEVIALDKGFITKLDAKIVGEVSMLLGAGRQKQDDSIDLSAGIRLNKKIGDYVEKGDSIAVLHTNNEAVLTETIEIAQTAIEIQGEKPIQKPLIISRVSKEGVKSF